MKKRNSAWLLVGMVLTAALMVGAPTGAMAQTQSQSAEAGHTVSGTVTDDLGEPLTGAIVRVKGQDGQLASCDIDGRYRLSGIQKNATLLVTYVGMDPQEIPVGGRTLINVRMKDENRQMNEVVVTAMGILRKEKSLTYATQKVTSDDFMKVQDANVANSLEGKVAGITITPSAGGAGGASKIMLRGNKSIMGSSSPLIVVDGVPMSNEPRDQITTGDIAYASNTEGGDPLSMINPDDIESINVLKGANAAALYGSRAANGVLMITTKKGREGKIDVSYNANVTMDTPLRTPDIQNIYGARVQPTGGLALDSWGERLDSRPASDLVVTAPMGANQLLEPTQEVYLRNRGADDIGDFFRTGVTLNNSVSLSGGTEKIKSYLSFANSHANGMMRSNNYNRNTVALRQTYKFLKRLTMDASLNYVQTKTKNRMGGGTVLNPLYHLYVAQRNLDMDYYRHNYARTGNWMSNTHSIYVQDGSSFTLDPSQRVPLEGLMQNWANMQAAQNNPYWLINQNRSLQKIDRIYGSFTGTVDIYDGLMFQARLSFDHTKFNGDSRRYATTFLPASMYDYGQYWVDYDKTNELYTDYLLSYNKTFKEDWDVSATAGWVGHVTHYRTQKSGMEATYYDPARQMLSQRINLFDLGASGPGATTQSKSTDWDKAALFTAQLGWKQRIYIDGSYRQDWYRAFKQFKDRGMSNSYGYFGVGANAVISSLAKLPDWISYLKYRVSYSEVGNTLPHILFNKGTENYKDGSVTLSNYTYYENPQPEKTKSFETGFESSFFGARLDVDLTFYNAVSDGQYMVGSNASGKAEPMNTGKVRNRGFEATVGYNYRINKDWRWKTSYNLSLNNNKILETIYNADGSEKLIATDVAGVRVRYTKGGSYGDMYVTDYKRNADGTLAVTSDGRVQFETENNKLYTVYAGNMNSKWQMGWSNTISYKNFQLFFFINGRLGGKVISLTEAYLDDFGVSQRTADARMAAEAAGLYTSDGQLGMYLPDGSGRVVPVENYYKSLGGSKNPLEYIYSATNFRLRELSLSYTFPNLVGKGTSLSLSFIGRNLFFFYCKSPADPDVALATGNGLSGFELFNMPTSRSYGFNVKLNF